MDSGAPKLYDTERPAVARARARVLHSRHNPDERCPENSVEVTKALAALQPLYGKDNVEIVTKDGTRVRGRVRSLKTTQALTKPSVKIERGDGEVVKITFDLISEIVDHNLY